jgi:hypothetical protein
MKRTVETKFYLFSQNNSGGSFHVDKKEGIAEYVIIEALSASDANRRAEAIGIYFDGVENDMDCPCCGDRWSSVYGDGDDVPKIYGKTIQEYRESEWKSFMRNNIVVHYMDGKVDWCDI